MWWIYAVGSAVFAALTSILAKIGIENVNSNLATAIRPDPGLGNGFSHWLPIRHKRNQQQKLVVFDSFRLGHWVFLVMLLSCNPGR